jgi:hypothetical protein
MIIVKILHAIHERLKRITDGGRELSCGKENEKISYKNEKISYKNGKISCKKKSY